MLWLARSPSGPHCSLSAVPRRVLARAGMIVKWRFGNATTVVAREREEEGNKGYKLYSG